MPGMKPAISTLPTDVSVMSAYRTAMMLGGMSASSVPAIAIEPVARRLS